VEGYTVYFIGFMTGIIINKIWNYIYSLGISTLLVKSAVNDSVIMLTKNVQSAYEINQLKYMALEMSGKDERFVEFQKSIDQQELSSMKNTMIRNFVNCIPPKYNHLVPFRDWSTAMDYINTELHKEKERQK